MSLLQVDWEFRSLCPGPGRLTHHVHNRDAKRPITRFVSAASASRRVPFQNPRHRGVHLSIRGLARRRRPGESRGKSGQNGIRQYEWRPHVTKTGPALVLNDTTKCAEGTLGSRANEAKRWFASGPERQSLPTQLEPSHGVGTGAFVSWLAEGKPLQKKSLTGDIVRPGLLVEARPFYIPKDGNEDVQVTTIGGSNAASDTGPSSRRQLHSSRIRRNPALPTGKTVLSEKHSMAGFFGVGLWRTKTPSWAD